MHLLSEGVRCRMIDLPPVVSEPRGNIIPTLASFILFSLGAFFGPNSVQFA